MRYQAQCVATTLRVTTMELAPVFDKVDGTVKLGPGAGRNSLHFRVQLKQTPRRYHRPHHAIGKTNQDQRAAIPIDVEHQQYRDLGPGPEDVPHRTRGILQNGSQLSFVHKCGNRESF